MADSLGIFVESGTLFLGGAGNDATISSRGLFIVVGTISSLRYLRPIMMDTSQSNRCIAIHHIP